jgi:hypothetical protein
MGRDFQVTKDIKVICNTSRTRTGFKHTATLVLRGLRQGTESVSYLNRTWERYEYQTVMQRLFEKTTCLSPQQKAYCLRWVEGDHTDWSGMEGVAAIAAMGDVLGRNRKEKNTFKKRMLVSGLGNQGLQMPDDFDSLPEKEKERRLNGAIGVLRKH